MRSKDGALSLQSPKRVFFAENSTTPLQLNAGRAGKSGRRKLSVVDWDGDGRLDILIDGKNANWLRQVADRNGQWFFRDMGPLGDRQLAGHDTSPTTVDFNADDVPDLLIGAEDGHFYYLRNPRIAAK
jgi:hypothetical protein